MSNMKHPIPQGKSKARGFTMVELVVVIAVIGILAAAAVAYFNRVRGDANLQVAQATGAMYARALDTICARTNAAGNATQAQADVVALLKNGVDALDIGGQAPSTPPGDTWTCNGNAGTIVWTTQCTQPSGATGNTITYTHSTNQAVCS